MRTALPANTKTRPYVVLMLVQRRWRRANIETALGQMLAFAGLHTGVCLHPPLRQSVTNTKGRGRPKVADSDKSPFPRTGGGQ